MTWKWDRVRKGVRDAYGHDIPKGALVAFGRRGFALCRACAKRYGVIPPRALTKKQEPQRWESDANDSRMRATPSGDR